jgi:hypothetical protein
LRIVTADGTVERRPGDRLLCLAERAAPASG